LGLGLGLELGLGQSFLYLDHLDAVLQRAQLLRVRVRVKG
jgi:hypothetical protein